MIFIHSSVNIDGYKKIGYRNHPLSLHIQKRTGKFTQTLTQNLQFAQKTT